MKTTMQKLILKQKFSKSVIQEKVNKMYAFDFLTTSEYEELVALIVEVYGED